MTVRWGEGGRHLGTNAYYVHWSLLYVHLLPRYIRGVFFLLIRFINAGVIQVCLGSVEFNDYRVNVYKKKGDDAFTVHRYQNETNANGQASQGTEQGSRKEAEY